MVDTCRCRVPSSGDITDASATGTITNHDALPKALIARFGRTAAVHVVEQVEERVNAPRAPERDGASDGASDERGRPGRDGGQQRHQPCSELGAPRPDQAKERHPS